MPAGGRHVPGRPGCGGGCRQALLRLRGIPWHHADRPVGEFVPGVRPHGPLHGSRSRLARALQLSEDNKVCGPGQLARPDLLTSCGILEDFPPEIRARLIAQAGAENVARGAGAGAVLEVDDTELRHQLVEAYGAKDLIFDSEVFSKTVKDDFGTLYRVEVPGDEDICVVKVLNATPEPDGTFQDYFLRVPPYVQTAREAVAWTFDMEEGYAPVAQT